MTYTPLLPYLAAACVVAIAAGVSVAGQAVTEWSAEETWEFSAASGERLELRLAYRRGAPVKTRAQTTVRSRVRPDFTRTYRIDQASDVLRSLTTTMDRVEALAFRASGPRFAPLFDGSETLLSVTAIPWYAREISVP